MRRGLGTPKSRSPRRAYIPVCTERMGIPGVHIHRLAGQLSQKQRVQDQLTPEKTKCHKANTRSLPTETKAAWQYQNPVLPQQQVLDTPNTPEKQELDLKSHLMMLIGDFKKDINNSLREI